MKSVFDLVSELTAIPSVSGREDMAGNALAKIVAEYFDEYSFSPLGSFVGYRRCGKKDAPTVLLDAHLDEVGFTVTEVCGGGFLRVCPVGKHDYRTLSASDVVVYGKKPVKGVFTSKPPHLQQPNESEKVLSMEDFAVDTGLSTDECKALITIGDPVALYGECEMLLGDRLMGRGFDDKLCIACILRILEMTKGKLDVDLVCEFTACEESGYKGAFTSPVKVKPDYCIVMDVTHAYVSGAEEFRRGICAGNGAVVSFSGTTSISFAEFAVKTAEKYDIPVQVAAEGNRTGSNANAVYISSGGAPTVLVSIPLKNMHTASEIADVRDFDLTASLVCEMLHELEGGACNA